MKRIATPMIGGVITSALLELLIYPIIYFIWRARVLPDQRGFHGSKEVIKIVREQ
jgi:Cu/Ag efflux pump CusA